METNEVQQQALSNAVNGVSMANYAAIISGFTAKGIPEADILPRHNVFTFNAWKALGRVVCKGEHGVKVHTWIPMTKKDADGNAQPIGRKPKMTTVFHVTQTKPIDGVSSAEIHAGQSELCKAHSAHLDKEIEADRKGFKFGGAINNPDYYSEEFTPSK